MKHFKTGIICCALALVLAFSALIMPGSAEAAGSIYVNNGQSTLDVGIGSAYVIGAGGDISVASGDYAITGDGIVKIGQAAGGGDGSTVTVKNTTVKVGLNYFYSSTRDTALTEARLENAIGSGYQFGYYDDSRVFHAVSSTGETQISMMPYGGGQGVQVTKTGTGTVLYTHDGSSGTRLAVHPIYNGGKAVTWFKGEKYFGDFEYYRYITDKLTVINVLGLEDYIKGVIPSEMSASWPTEALKAQALCARTYYASNASSYSRYGFDVTADTYSQAYQGTRRASANSDVAVDATAGLYVTYGGKLCSTLYYSSNGGASEDSENIFPNYQPYLRGKIDPYEEAVPASMNGKKTWTRQLTAAEIAAKLTSYGITNPADIQPTYSAMGNVIKLTFLDVNGNSATVAKSSCYSVLGLPSVRYTITRSASDPNTYVFEGSGWGHNVGMSQFGAYSMAQFYGMDYTQIIKFYYTGVSISAGIQ